MTRTLPGFVAIFGVTQNLCPRLTYVAASRLVFGAFCSTALFRMELSGLFRQGFANSASYDRVFTGLQHPDSDYERVGIGRDALVGFLAGVRVQFNGRLP